MPRNFNKKLVLNKKTIANLNDAAMKGVFAGGPTVAYTEGPHLTCTGSRNPEDCCVTVNTGP